MNPAAKVIVAKPAEQEMTLSEKIRAMATPRKIVDGKIILDRNNPSDREWFEDTKIGQIFK